MAAPCTPWTTTEDASECCDVGSDDSVLADAVEAASSLLHQLTPLFGICERTVRPCATQRRCFGPWGAWTGRGWWPWESASSISRGCGCSPVDRVPLAGHALDIIEVTIDGAVVDPDTYRLDEAMWLTRVNDPADLDTDLWWPSCQNERLPLTEEGTFGIRYEYGHEVPPEGVLAANELACAVWQSCPGNGDGEAECVLPSGVTQITRLGVTIDLAGFTSWALQGGMWRTGLAFVDQFLSAYAPLGRQQRPTQVWSPDLWKYPRPVTQSGS